MKACNGCVNIYQTNNVHEQCSVEEKEEENNGENENLAIYNHKEFLCCYEL